YILTIIDVFSKWAEALPIKNKEATTVARVLLDVFLCRFGLPIQILSDLGKEFENKVMHEMCRVLGIDKIRTTAYKPSTNGGIERFHRTLNTMLGKVVETSQRDWDERLPGVMAAYRASRHETTGFSPNYLILGREARAPIDLVLGEPNDEAGEISFDSFVDNKIAKLQEAYALVREHTQQSANRAKKYYELRVKARDFNVGDWVYYYSPRRYVGKTPKWQRMFSGPYLVIRQLGPVNYVIQL